MLKQWENLPDFMKVDEVKPYWEMLYSKKGQLLAKRMFDFLIATVLFVILLIPMAIIATVIKMEDRGPVFYRQERVTQYGKHFRIHKFRTMVVNADEIGTAVTTNKDKRITSIGKKLRSKRLDELPQVIDVLVGNMSFVGTRPEAVKYVDCYEQEYKATLLLPAGITSETSIRYKDEAKLLNEADNADEVYVNRILPEKMKWNLKSIEQFCLLNEFRTLLRTVTAVCGKEYD